MRIHGFGTEDDAGASHVPGPCNWLKVQAAAGPGSDGPDYSRERSCGYEHHDGRDQLDGPRDREGRAGRAGRHSPRADRDDDFDLPDEDTWMSGLQFLTPHETAIGNTQDEPWEDTRRFWGLVDIAMLLLLPMTGTPIIVMIEEAVVQVLTAVVRLLWFRCCLPALLNTAVRPR